MANKKKIQRHLTLTDRVYIEQELVRGSNFTEIGKALKKDPSTIAKEVKLHYEVRKASYNAHGCGNCVIYADCIKQHALYGPSTSFHKRIIHLSIERMI